ncbi:hypothetical protein TNCV_3967841 [Trichonephila clavipes]|nr:hypothetical protein TNCV_3967841 [Trichonephila clavipes]
MITSNVFQSAVAIRRALTHIRHQKMHPKQTRSELREKQIRGFLTNGALAGIGNREGNKSKTADSEDTRHSKCNFPRVRDLIHGQERKGSEQEGPFPGKRS